MPLVAAYKKSSVECVENNVFDDVYPDEMKMHSIIEPLIPDLSLLKMKITSINSLVNVKNHLDVRKHF